MILKPALIALLTTLSSVAFAQSPATSTLIRDVTVFDGLRNAGRHGVLIENGKIANPDFKGKPKAGTRIVDGKGKTLLPGLIDSHVHAFQAGDDPLLFGVTTQLDMFMPLEFTKDVREKTKHGENTDVADLYSAGILATVPKGHGTEYGMQIPTLTKPEEADAWVAARVAEGSDYIKIVNEPGSSFGRALPTLDSATIRALIVAAHKRGKLAVVHVQNLDAATDALNSGADGLAHLFIDKDGGTAFANLAKAKGAFITPTMTVFEAFSGRAGSAGLLDHPAFSGLLSKQAGDTLKQSIGADRSAKFDATEAANVSALVKAGVPILAGTDSGNLGTWYGVSLHREMELLVKAGLTPTQALAAATANPAQAFHLADRGRIAKGLKADLVLVDGDPTTNIAATRNIVEIWKNGQSANHLRDERRAVLAKAATQKGYPLITLPGDGRIAAFSTEGGKAVMKAPFGAGWGLTTDSIVGGESTVALSEAAGVLSIKGDVKAGGFAQWAGIAFNPAAEQFRPANLSTATAIRFRARGEGPGFGVMGFSEASGRAPITGAFAVGKDWAEVTVKFSDLKGFDPASTTLLTITALKPGPYRLEVSDVRLLKE
jgi:imidazolonepropionase-like amidohydrolase